MTDPGLDDRTRSRFNRDAEALLHDCSELEGLFAAARGHYDYGGASCSGERWVAVTDGQPADS